MAASNASLSYNTLLKRISTVVGEVTNISGPGMSRSDQDVSFLNSDNPWKEFLGGEVDPGEITFDINFQPGSASHKQLIADLSGPPIAWEIVWSDSGATVWGPCNGYVKAFSPSAANGGDSKLSASVTVKLTGKPTFPA